MSAASDMLAEEMEELGLSAEDVANELDVDPSEVQAWLDGMEQPDIDSAAFLEDWLLIPCHLWVDEALESDES